jgi:hypothetical protein
MNLRQRTDAFWAWFLENEETLSDMVENRAKYSAQKIVDFVKSGVELLADNVQYNMGGDHEFTFAVDGKPHRFYLYPYVISRMPEKLEGKWKFFPCMQSIDGRNFGFEMHGKDFDMQAVMVASVFNDERAIFDLRYYHPNFVGMAPKDASHVCILMTELCVGEGMSGVYVGKQDLAENLEEGMMPLTGLEKYITKTLNDAGKEMMNSPSQRYNGYRMQPQPETALRYDVISGSTRFMYLISDYYANETWLIDHIEKYGAKAVFLTFAYAEGEDRNALLQKRYDIEDRLETEVLGTDGSGEEIGILLGGAMGEQCVYVDLLLYDEEAFWEKVKPVLAQFPYKFYLSSFKQNAELVQLFSE